MMGLRSVVFCVVVTSFLFMVSAGQGKNIIAGSFSKTNSLNVGDSGIAIWDPTAKRWLRPKVPLTYNTAGWVTAGVSADTDVLVGIDPSTAVRVFASDLSSAVVYGLGIESSGDGTTDPKVQSDAWFDCFQPKGFNQPCAASISRVATSGVSVLTCGTFNRIGTISTNLTNNNNGLTTNLALFTLQAKMNDNARGKWKFTWPQAYDGNGVPDLASGPQSVNCATLVGVGTNGDFLIETTESVGARDMWRYNAGTNKWTVFAENYSLRTTPPLSFYNGQVYVYGRNFIAQGENFDYLLAKPITSVVATEWKSMMSPNTSYTSTLQDYIVDKAGSIYCRFPNENQGLIDFFHREFRAAYVWKYTPPAGGPGSTEVDWSGTVLGGLYSTGGGKIRLTSSSQAACCGEGTNNGNKNVVNGKLFYDVGADKVVLYDPSIRYQLFGDVEITSRGVNQFSSVNFISSINREIAEYQYRSIPVPNIIAFGTEMWEPIYGGGLTLPAGTWLENHPLGGRIYVRSTSPLDFVYNTHLHNLFTSEYDDDNKRWAVSSILGDVTKVPFDFGLDAFPKLGGAPQVYFAKWISDNQLLLAGSFRSVFKIETNSIVILEKTDAVPKINTLPSGGSCDITTATTKTPACFQVGVRNTGGTTAWSRAFRSPGSIRDVVVDGSRIYVAGTFDTVGNIAAKNIAYFDTDSDKWSNMRGGSWDTIYSMVWFDGNLWVSGTWVQVGDTISSKVAYWDGASWQQPNNALTSANNVYKLYPITSPSQLLYAGGDFTSASGLKVSYLAAWDPKDEKWTNVELKTEGTPCFDANYHDTRVCNVAGTVYDIYNIRGDVYLAIQDGSTNSIWDYDSRKGFQKTTTYQKGRLSTVSGDVQNFGFVDFGDNGLHLSVWNAETSYATNGNYPDRVDTSNQLIWKPGPLYDDSGYKKNFMTSNPNIEGGVDGTVYFATDSPDKNRQSGGLSGGAIAGIVIGSIVGAAILVVVVVVIAKGAGGGGGGEDYVSWSR